MLKWTQGPDDAMSFRPEPVVGGAGQAHGGGLGRFLRASLGPAGRGWRAWLRALSVFAPWRRDSSDWELAWPDQGSPRCRIPSGRTTAVSLPRRFATGDR